MSSTTEFADLRLVKADQRHIQDVLNFSKGIYNGLDYFEAVYPRWLEEERNFPSLRKNVVMVDSTTGKAIGFQSFLFHDNGNRVQAQALRIDQSKKGTGLGKIFMHLCKDFLLKCNREVCAKIY